MIPSTIYIDGNTISNSIGIPYDFMADTMYNMAGKFIVFYYDSKIEGFPPQVIVYGENFKDAESKMIEVLQNAGILPKPEVKRSVLQNALYWKWMEVVSEETGNNKDVVHALMKKNFLSKRKLVKLGGKRNYVNIEGSTKELSVKRFTKFLDDIYQFFAERELFLPTMDKLDMDSLINTYGNM